MTKGERIKHRREQLGISQTELAECIGTSKQNLYKYENDIITNIPSDRVEALVEKNHDSVERLNLADRITEVEKANNLYLDLDTQR